MRVDGRKRGGRSVVNMRLMDQPARKAPNWSALSDKSD